MNKNTEHRKTIRFAHFSSIETEELEESSQK